MIERLLTSLEMLAAPAEMQEARLPPAVTHPDEMAREFDDALLLTRQCQSHRIGLRQAAALDALDDRLSELGGTGGAGAGADAGGAGFWTADALRHHPGWRDVRRLAEAALATIRADTADDAPDFDAVQPTLTGPRLVLRPFTPADAPDVQRLAGDAAVADTTLNVPHPYPDGAAERWIASSRALFAHGEDVRFAVTTPADGLVGAIGMRLAPRHSNAELGYWIGRPFWGRGYATEAAHLVVHYGFTQRRLHRIIAHHLTRNPASGRVMIKLGMQHEGHLREHVRKHDRLEDLEVYGLLRSEYAAPEWLAGR